MVTGFALIQGGGQLRPADTLLLVAIAVAGLGYAEGGALAREHGGWRVICWAVLLALPVTGPVTLAAVITGQHRPVSAGAVAGLCYVGAVSMCFGFFAWYHAMAVGGVARVGRLQLAQPALTLGWSALLLGEHVGWLSAVAAAAVIGATAVGRNARVDIVRTAAAGAAGTTPAGTTPAGTTPAGTTPAGTTPAGTTPAGTTPAGTTPAGTTPAGTTPAGTTPAGTTPAGTTPAGTTPAGTTPAGAEPAVVIVGACLTPRSPFR